MRLKRKSALRQILPPFKVCVGLFALVCLTWFGVSGLAIAGSGGSSGQQRLVKIIDGEEEQSFLTRASTLEQLFKEEDIVVDEKDALNMSRYERLTETYYEVEIRHARPVVIIDGVAMVRVLTTATSAEEIAKEAGIVLYEADTTELRQVRDFASAGAGLEMTITRNDVMIWVEETVAIPYEVEQQKEYSKEKDFKEVLVTGEMGVKKNYYKVTVKAGKERERELMRSETVKEPVTQVERIGVKYSGIATTPTENERITWDFLRAQGFSREQAAGIMGNLMQEHRFNTDGDGLAQWTGGRKARLMALDDPYSIYTQLDFMMSELNGSYLAAKNAILASITIEDATIAFQNIYERCGICVEDRRIGYAISIYERYDY